MQGRLHPSPIPLVAGMLLAALLAAGCGGDRGADPFVSTTSTAARDAAVLADGTPVPTVDTRSAEQLAALALQLRPSLPRGVDVVFLQQDSPYAKPHHPVAFRIPDETIAQLVAQLSAAYGRSVRVMDGRGLGAACGPAIIGDDRGNKAAYTQTMVIDLSASRSWLPDRGVCQQVEYHGIDPLTLPEAKALGQQGNAS